MSPSSFSWSPSSSKNEKGHANANALLLPLESYQDDGLCSAGIQSKHSVRGHAICCSAACEENSDLRKPQNKEPFTCGGSDNTRGCKKRKGGSAHCCAKSIVKVMNNAPGVSFCLFVCLIRHQID